VVVQVGFNLVFLMFYLYVYVQIGIKAEWRAHQGHLVLFLGNKNTAPLISVHALILPPIHLKMELSLVPDTIPPRAQVRKNKLLLLSVAFKYC
jgi:hypothetical protein